MDLFLFSENAPYESVEVGIRWAGERTNDQSQDSRDVDYVSADIEGQ